MGFIHCSTLKFCRFGCWESLTHWYKLFGLCNIRGIKQGNNGVIVSLDQSVYGLFPVPLGAQVCLRLCEFVYGIVVVFSWAANWPYEA